MHVHTLILGAGAAGMMASAHAGPDTLIVDHAKAPGEKIRISGGGRCNFTNLHTSHENFISQNPHFAKSALSRYTQWDFIERVQAEGISYHEKTLGQLFCDTTAKDIIAMLRDDMGAAGATLWLNTSVGKITKSDCFEVTLIQEGSPQVVTADNLIVATGGKSIPKMGATGMAYQIAEQFGLAVVSPEPALVPFVFDDDLFKPLAGTALNTRAVVNGATFEEASLFTHRGLSGPAILQVSSYWNDGDALTLDLLPAFDLAQTLKDGRQTDGRKSITTILAQHLPKRLVDSLADDLSLRGNLADWSDRKLDELTAKLRQWVLTPDGTEGYRTAEVTRGGVDTECLSARTMEAKSVSNLFFIGEAVDVTGWLGGYNFQWAWSSGWAAGTAIAERRL